MYRIKDELAELGRDLRERRVAAGLSQVAVARTAGVGRSTLIHLEQGSKDVRLSNAQAVARAVGTTVTVGGEPMKLAERRQLRSEEALRLARRREAHLHLAVGLALGRRESLRALAEARRMVHLWQRDRTCSDFYIKEWSRVLGGNAAQVARRIQEITPDWLDAMLQNTPFSRALAAA